jgi:Domain of unknown function (DUF5615)
VANLYVDEQFPLPVSTRLKALGHSILTVQEANKLGYSDLDVLVFARNHNRIVLSQNRQDFIRLHNNYPILAGIIVCTEDRDLEALAQRINQMLLGTESFENKLFRINRIP